MQLIAGRVGQAYNRRKARKGAFWGDRDHATAVEAGTHLAHCLVYIDLNMVRAGVVRHASEWGASGYRQTQAPPDRYRVIDQHALLESLEIGSPSGTPLASPCTSDAYLGRAIRSIWEANFKAYGIRKVWHALRRQGATVARCTVASRMQALGLRGATRGKALRTTRPAAPAACQPDQGHRQFRAERPNALWVADITYVARRRAGFVYAVFITDAFSRRIVGWRRSVCASGRMPCVMNTPSSATEQLPDWLRQHS